MKGAAVLVVSVTLACPVAAATVDQKTQGPCSPTIAEVTGEVKVTCNLSNEDLRLNAHHNWEIAKRDAHVLLQNHTEYLLPALAEYSVAPTPAKWAEIRHRLELTRTELDAAMRSALDYQATMPGGDSTQLQGIRRLYMQRGAALSELEVQVQPMPVAALQQWEDRYSALVKALYKELDQFDETTLSKTAKR